MIIIRDMIMDYKNILNSSDRGRCYFVKCKIRKNWCGNNAHYKFFFEDGNEFLSPGFKDYHLLNHGHCYILHNHKVIYDVTRKMWIKYEKTFYDTR